MALATLGVVVPGLAALYEFGVKGRKRLGYRVQMDTTASNVVKTEHDGPFAQLMVGARKLEDPTIVLLRIENNGATNIDESDYSRPHSDDTGITVTFTDRNVVGAVITEVSDTNMRSSFQNGGGFTVKDNVLELPKVPMNRAELYKVLIALEREPGSNSDDCRNRDPGSPAGVVRCARDSTDAVLRTVASTPGAMGYSELGAAANRKGLVAIRINGHPATVADADHGTYPFWETEFGTRTASPRPTRWRPASCAT